MIFFVVLFHGLKLGFEYLPDLGSKGTLVVEIGFIRMVFIFDSGRIVEDVPSDVQDGD